LATANLIHTAHLATRAGAGFALHRALLRFRAPLPRGTVIWLISSAAAASAKVSASLLARSPSKPFAQAADFSLLTTGRPVSLPARLRTAAMAWPIIVKLETTLKFDLTRLERPNALIFEDARYERPAY
jgi:hypothetical protein